MDPARSRSLAVALACLWLSWLGSWAAAQDVQFAYYPSYGFIRVRFQGDMFRSPDGKPGLRGEYFPNAKLEGTPVATRVDATPVRIRRGTRAPAEGMPPENWTARWTGTYGPVPQDGRYEFKTWTDDRVRLWVDGKLIVDDWHDHPPAENRASAHLRAGKSVPVKIEFYQGVGGATCHVEARLIDPVTVQTNTATVTVSDAAGKEWLNRKVNWSPAGSESRLHVGDLPNGTYALKVMPAGEGKPFEASFRRILFPWENSNLGVTNKVYPPFGPIEIDGDRLRVVLREYKVNGLGLWDSVRASGNVSAGGPEELLAGPIRLLVNGGQALEGEGQYRKLTRRVVDRWEGTRPIFKEERYFPDHGAVYEARASHPAVDVSTRCTTEYDGCMKVELTLRPGQESRRLESLVLEVPVRESMAPLFHVSAAGLRKNPAGRTPAGEGRVWDSRVDIPAVQGSSFHGNFKPYIWLGAEERGLCWFADNDANWVVDLANDTPCLTLDRENEAVVLRVHLVQKPVTLTGERTITFGLMVSPAKPMPPDWRLRLLGPAQGHFKSRVFTMNYAADGMFAFKYPSNGDFSIFDKVQALRLGAPVQDVWKLWLANNEDKWSDYLRNKRFAHLVNTLIGLGTSRADYMSMYFEEFTSTHQAHPSAHVFQCEWSGEYHHKLLDQVSQEWERLAVIKTGAVTRSYRDFACWYAAEWIRRGIGTYFDNAFPIGVTDLVTTTAYRMDDGRVQPSCGMWARREYLKRVWVLHQQLAPANTKPMMMIHMTNTHILPYMVWNECNLDLEWGTKEPIQAQWPAALLRTESLGRQTGNVPVGMSPAENTPMALMVHEAGMFMRYPGREFMQLLVDYHYGLDDCTVYNYWDPNSPVVVGDDRAKWLLLKHNDRLLLLVCTWNPEASTVPFTFDVKALGMSPLRAAVRAYPVEGQEPRTIPAVDNRRFDIPLAGYGTAVVELQ